MDVGVDASDMIADACATVATPGGVVAAATVVLPCTGRSLPAPSRLAALEDRCGVDIAVLDAGSALTRASVRITRRGAAVATTGWRARLRAWLG
jgi:hypothetical protein